MSDFDKYERRGAYHWDWYHKNIDNYVSQVNKVLLNFPNSGSILDAGCGDGLISYKLYERGLHVYGIDNDPLSIKLAEEKCKKHISAGKLYFQCKSISDLNVRNCSTEFTLCHGVLEHVRDAKSAFETLYSVTRKHLLIMVPNTTGYKPDRYDFHAWNDNNIGSFFKGYDYEILSADKLYYVKVMKNEVVP